MQPGTSRLGDLLVCGVAEQRVPEPDRTIGRDQQARLQGSGCHLVGVFEGELFDLGPVDRAGGHGCDLEESADISG